MMDVISHFSTHYPPTFHVGQLVQLVPDKWQKQYRNTTGRVREMTWETPSLGFPDGYGYLVELDGQGITVRANSEGLAALEAAYLNETLPILKDNGVRLVLTAESTPGTYTYSEAAERIWRAMMADEVRRRRPGGSYEYLFWPLALTSRERLRKARRRARLSTQQRYTKR